MSSWVYNLPKHLEVLSKTSDEILKGLDLGTPREYAKCRLIILAIEEHDKGHATLDQKISEELTRRIKDLPS